MKACLYCNRPLARGETERPHVFEARQHCDRRCLNLGRKITPENALTEGPAMRLCRACERFFHDPGDEGTATCSPTCAEDLRLRIETGEWITVSEDEERHISQVKLILGTWITERNRRLAEREADMAA